MSFTEVAPWHPIKEFNWGWPLAFRILWTLRVPLSYILMLVGVWDRTKIIIIIPLVVQRATVSSNIQIFVHTFPLQTSIFCFFTTCFFKLYSSSIKKYNNQLLIYHGGYKFLLTQFNLEQIKLGDVSPETWQLTPRKPGHFLVSANTFPVSRNTKVKTKKRRRNVFVLPVLETFKPN